MSDTEEQIAALEREMRARGVEPPDLRSTNPDPEAREAEQREALEGFYRWLAAGQKASPAKGGGEE